MAQVSIRSKTNHANQRLEALWTEHPAGLALICFPLAMLLLGLSSVVSLIALTVAAADSTWGVVAQFNEPRPLETIRGTLLLVLAGVLAAAAWGLLIRATRQLQPLTTGLVSALYKRPEQNFRVESSL